MKMKEIGPRGVGAPWLLGSANVAGQVVHEFETSKFRALNLDLNLKSSKLSKFIKHRRKNV